MTVTRSSFWTLLVLAGFTLAAHRSAAQDNPPLPVKNGTAVSEVSTYKEAKGIPAGELKKARESFAAFAKYYADVVAHPTVYKAAQDPKVAAGAKVPTIDYEANGILKELERFILVPNPFLRTSSDDPTPKVNADSADYIREFGAAFDAALKPLIETHPERIVKVNAARVLADICRSGSTAHYATLTALLTNPETPTEIKYYALQAAANLLAAWDPTDYKSRRHTIQFLNDRKKGAGDKELAALVAAIEKCVTDPNALMPGLPEKKIENASSDQLGVIAFVRRQAVRALEEVRFVSISDGPTTVYPSYTLVRVCMSDPALVPAPTPGECAEAAIGLCHMAPNAFGNPIKGYNGDVAAEAVVTAVATFAAPRAAKTEDRSLPWRGYSARLADALKTWPPLFDPLFEATNPTKFNPKDAPEIVRQVTERIQTLVLTPIDKVDSTGKPDPLVKVDIQRLKDYLQELQRRPKRNTLLFEGNPATTITFPEKK